MRILYLNLDRGIPVLGDKGASVHVRSFVRAAAALGHEVVLVCPTLGEGNPPPPARILHLPLEAPENFDNRRRESSDETAVVLRRERARLAYDAGAPARIFQSLEAIGFRPDIIYERHALFHACGADVAARYGVPRLLEVNAPLIEEQRAYRGLRLEDEARTAELRSYRAATAVVAVSEAVAAHVGEVLGGRERVHVVPNGVDLERFLGGPPTDSALRHRLGLGAGPVIGFVGSFKPWHGVAFLLDVFSSLAGEFPDARLVAVGEGPERQAVVNRALALGLGDRVVLPGRAPHEAIPAWLEAMDLTVAPYLPRADFYFSPLKIVESLAAARPVVAPRLGQIEAILDDGVTGRLYGPGDSDACRTALRELLSAREDLARMGERARASAASLSWTGVVGRILDLAPRSGLREAAA